MLNAEKLLKGITEHQRDMFNRKDFEEKSKLHYQIVKVHNNIINLEPGIITLLKILADKIEKSITMDMDNLVKLCILADHNLVEPEVKAEIDHAMLCMNDGKFDELDNIPQYVKMWEIAEAEFGKTANEFTRVLKNLPKDADLTEIVANVVKMAPKM